MPSEIMRLQTVLLVSLLFNVVGAGAQSISEKAQNDEVIVRDNSDPAMRKALAHAAQTLPDFLKLAADPKPGTTSYALKVAISDGRNTEYFWVNKFGREGRSFVGTLSNEPRLVKIHRNDDRITFTENQIVDWMYIDDINRRMVGNFTACALLSKEPPAQAAAFKRQYGLTCEE
jgi:uncharacterized protein YegJ (DUF2314 family)